MGTECPQVLISISSTEKAHTISVSARIEAGEATYKRLIVRPHRASQRRRREHPVLDQSINSLRRSSHPNSFSYNTIRYPRPKTMFKRLSISAWAIAVLATTAQCQQLSYEDSIAALAYGNVATDTSSAGEVWLNVTGFAVEELPHIQSDVGIHTLDNLETLTAIAGLAQDAAKRGQWGDIVYLHSAFSMNGHVDHLNVSSVEMQESLLEAVTNRTSGKTDSPLVELYANTSSSTFLAEAFKNLKSDANPQRKRWTKEACSTAHRAVTRACRSLLGNINDNATWKSGGPRNICQYGCCISWSANATFQLQNLSSAGNYCVNACASSTVSCEIYGVTLQGTVVDQCLSNRANGCT